MRASVPHSQLVWMFWGAALLSVGLPHLPFGEFVVYPFALLATWAHELGHGLTALLVGGDIEYLVLYSNLGGYARSVRPDTAFAHVAIAVGGLLAPALAGGSMVMFGARESTATWVLDVLGGMLILSALLWIRNGFGFVAIFGLGLTLIAVGHFAPAIIEIAVVQFTGIRLCVESMSDIDYMFTSYFVRGGTRQPSDTQTIAEHLLLPYWVWGGLIAAVSVGILVLSFSVACKRSAAEADVGDGVDRGR